MQYLRYRENKRRGTADFPFELYHVTRRHPDYVMPLHWHPEFELIRVLKGKLALNVADRQYLLGAGFFVIIPSNLPHSAMPTACEYECIVFDATILLGKNEETNRIVKRMLEHTINPKYLHLPNASVIHDAAWQLFESLATREEGYQMIVLGSLSVILGTIVKDKLFSTSTEKSEYGLRKSIRLQQAMTFMEESFQKHLTLEDIANSIGMTPKSFCRFFKETAHISPIEYLNSYRIDRASYQMLTTDMSITEIAYENGFNDLSYFIKTFKKYKGTTPKKYAQTFIHN